MAKNIKKRIGCKSEERPHICWKRWKGPRSAPPREMAAHLIWRSGQREKSVTAPEMWAAQRGKSVSGQREKSVSAAAAEKRERPRQKSVRERNVWVSCDQNHHHDPFVRAKRRPDIPGERVSEAATQVINMHGCALH